MYINKQQTMIHSKTIVITIQLITCQARFQTEVLVSAYGMTKLSII